MSENCSSYLYFDDPEPPSKYVRNIPIDIPNPKSLDKQLKITLAY